MFRPCGHFSPGIFIRARLPRLAAAAAAIIASVSAQPASNASAGSVARSTPVLFPPVIVAAAGYEATAFEMPYSTSVLTSEALTRRLPRTLPMALEELPGFMVQKTSTAQGAPYLRGFTGFRTLLLVDGIRLNNSVFREGPNQYWGTLDPLAIERIEVVNGPASDQLVANQ
jgi:hemoglobin/transferrin/lactoferrin receptor protein